MRSTKDRAGRDATRREGTSLSLQAGRRIAARGNPDNSKRRSGQTIFVVSLSVRSFEVLGVEVQIPSRQIGCVAATRPESVHGLRVRSTWGPDLKEHGDPIVRCRKSAWPRREALENRPRASRGNAAQAERKKIDPSLRLSRLTDHDNQCNWYCRAISRMGLATAIARDWRPGRCGIGFQIRLSAIWSQNDELQAHLPAPTRLFY